MGTEQEKLLTQALPQEETREEVMPPDAAQPPPEEAAALAGSAAAPGMTAQAAQTVRELPGLTRREQGAEVMRRTFRRLWQQGQALKQLMPNFDLDMEMKDPRFVRLVHPDVGLDVETAFQVAHRRELEPLLLNYAVKEAARQLAQSVACGQSRPPENGASQEAVEVQEDPRLWSPQQKAEVRQRVRRGERVVF